VSNATAALSKFTIPIVFVPLLSFAITFVTHFLILLMSGAISGGSGAKRRRDIDTPSFVHISLLFLYHLLLVHGLWDAPFYGWLLLVSAWAPRVPFIGAFLPPFVICGR
jgi:ABC-2 type transport system permease protein